MDVARVAFDITQLCMTGISMPIYIAVILVIWYYRKHDESLRSSFFSLFFSLGIADIITAMDGCLVIQGRTYGFAYAFFEFAPWINKGELLLQQYIPFVQCAGLMLISLNRYSAMAAMVGHGNQDWSKIRFRLAITAQWMIPFVIIAPGAYFGLGDVTLTRFTNETVIIGIAPYYWQHGHLDVLLLYWKIGFGFNCITSLLTFYLYGVAFYKILKLRRSSNFNNSSPASQKFGVEYRLIIYGSLCSFFMLIKALFSLYMSSGVILSSFHFMLAFIMNDLFNYSNPYTLLALSHVVRKRFQLTFCHCFATKMETGVITVK